MPKRKARPKKRAPEYPIVLYSTYGVVSVNLVKNGVLKEDGEVVNQMYSNATGPMVPLSKETGMFAANDIDGCIVMGNLTLGESYKETCVPVRDARIQPHLVLAEVPGNRLLVTDWRSNAMGLMCIDSADLVPLKGHTSTATHAAVVRWNRLVTVGSKEMTLWDTTTAKLLRTHTLPVPITALVALHDGSLAVGQGEEGLVLWDVDDWEQISDIFEASPCGAVASVDSTTLLAGRGTDLVSVDLEAEEVTLVGEGRYGPITHIQLLPRGQVVTAGAHDEVVLWCPVEGGGGELEVSSSLTAHSAVQALAVVRPLTLPVGLERAARRHARWVMLYSRHRLRSRK